MAMHPEVRFHLKRSKVCNLETSKQEAIEIEDDLLLSRFMEEIKKVSSKEDVQNSYS